MTEIVQYQQPTALTEQMDYARTVSTASMLPDSYRGKPADILLAVGLGQSMGLSPAESLYRIAVIKGKPTASAELIAANVRKAGHRLRVATDEQARSVTATVFRADDPDFAFEVTRDMAWAQSMGLATNDNYRKQALTMLQWRAITAVARLACPEALYGVAYTPDEMAETEPAKPQPTTSANRLRSALGTTVTAEQVENEPEAEHEPAPIVPPGDDAAFDAAYRKGGPVPIEGVPLNTGSKLAKAMYAGINEGGIPESDRIEFICGVIGRVITSTKEMTEDEARIVLDNLARLKADENGATS
jgi:hypothetical protein